MKKINILISVALILVLAATFSYATSMPKLHIELDGNTINLTEKPIIYNNRTLIPLRGFLERLGAKVDWNSQTRQAVVKTKDVEILLNADSNYALVNGKIHYFDTPSKIINDRLYVPLRFVSSSLGHDVDWNHLNRAVIVNTKKYVANHKLSKIKSEDEFISLLSMNSSLNNYVLGFTRMKGMAPLTGVMESDSAPMNAKSNSTAGNTSSNDFSTVNNQVEGVIEGDITVTNGKYIATTSNGNELILVKVNNGKQEKVFSKKINEYINELYITSDKLVVISSKYIRPDYIDKPQNPMPIKELPTNEVVKSIKLGRMMYGHSMTNILVYNLDSDKPVVAVDKMFDGDLKTARLIANNLYAITNKYINFYINQPIEIDGILPRQVNNLDGAVYTKQLQDIYYLPGYVAPNMTNMISLNIENGVSNFDTYLGSSEAVYANKESIYLTQTNYNYYFTKMAKKYLPQYRNTTNIYKFAMKDGKIEYVIDGEVEGTILNQFSLDEYNGDFRIATTTGNRWDENNLQKNHLFILDDQLKEVGSIKGLAEGERIYSVRFYGKRVYIVTFKNVDPLFVIDASDRSNPKVLGELKIPGFSTYMHILDENHILGFGNDAFEKNGNTRVGGFKISLFDVTNPQKPVEKKSEIIGVEGTYSELRYNHKALMISLDKGLFAFPINVSGETPYVSSFNGAYVYNLKTDDFSYRGKISNVVNESKNYGYFIKRVLYIGDYLYTVSDRNITSTNIDTMLQEDSLEISK